MHLKIIDFIYFRIMALAPFLKSILYYLKNRNVEDIDLSSFLKIQLKYLFFCLIGIEKRLAIEKKYYASQERIFNYQIKKLETINSGETIKLGNIIFQKMQNLAEYSELIYGYDDIFIQDKFFNLQKKLNPQFFLPLYREGEGPYEIKDVQIQKNDIVIDAGANIGIFSLLAAKKGTKKVFAFEPNPNTYQLLRKNISLNQFTDIIIPQEIGLFSKKCKTDFIQTTGNIGSSRILNINKNIPGEKCEINLISLDEWMDTCHIESIDFIKADIEGAERQLIEGAKKTIEKNHPRLALCTYHLPDDREVLTKKILEIDPTYKFSYTKMKLFAW